MQKQGFLSYVVINEFAVLWKISLLKIVPSEYTCLRKKVNDIEDVLGEENGEVIGFVIGFPAHLIHKWAHPLSLSRKKVWLEKRKLPS
jgi:hypothetical protein